jgi:hypothetical protein
MKNAFDTVTTQSNWEDTRTIEIGKTKRLGALFANLRISLYPVVSGIKE